MKRDEWNALGITSEGQSLPQVGKGLTYLYRRLSAAAAEASAEQIQDAVDTCYRLGGQPFLEAVEQYAVNERGEPARLPGWFRELLLLIGDFRVRETYTSGIAQFGKTLSHTWLVCYVLTELGLNTLWSYDQQTSLNIQVPSNFRPVIEGPDPSATSGWLGRKGLTKTPGPSNNLLYQVGYAFAQFIYVSTSRQRAGTSGSAAGSIAVGVSRDIYIAEEYSQYPPGAGDVPKRRLDSSRLDTKPIRYLGTPGSGQGIEKLIAQADYQFYLHYECPHCGAIAPLDPFGCLLKPTQIKDEAGNAEESYLSVSGRPDDWHHSDPNNPVESARFGCSSCGEHLPDETRAAAWYADLKSGIRLRDFLDNLPEGVPRTNISASIEISPLARIEKVNTAADIIQEGIRTQNPNDWCEQRLGKPSTSAANSITRAMMDSAIAAPAPERKPDFTVAGADFGRSEDWLIIEDVWLPENFEDKPLAQVMEECVRAVRFGADVNRAAIPHLLNEYGVDYGIIDSEPDVPDAARLCDGSVLEMADQKSGTDYQAKKGQRESGGQKFSCWNFRYNDFQSIVLAALTLKADDGHPLLRFPEAWRKWQAMPEERRSPIRHFSTMRRDPESKKWERPADHCDDLFFAQMFAELALLLYIKAGNANTRSPAGFTAQADAPSTPQPARRKRDQFGRARR